MNSGHETHFNTQHHHIWLKVLIVPMHDKMPFSFSSLPCYHAMCKVMPLVKDVGQNISIRVPFIT